MHLVCPMGGLLAFVETTKRGSAWGVEKGAPGNKVMAAHAGLPADMGPYEVLSTGNGPD